MVIVAEGIFHGLGKLDEVGMALCKGPITPCRGRLEDTGLEVKHLSASSCVNAGIHSARLLSSTYKMRRFHPDPNQALGPSPFSKSNISSRCGRCCTTRADSEESRSIELSLTPHELLFGLIHCSAGANTHAFKA